MYVVIVTTERIEQKETEIIAIELVPKKKVWKNIIF